MKMHTKSLVDLRPMADEISTNAVNNLPKPNAQQLAFQDLEMGLFIHISISTFTGEEHECAKVSVKHAAG